MIFAPMHNELTNLLPPERKRAVSRRYFLRLGVVIAVLVTSLVGATAVLLIPTYVFLDGSENAKKSHLTTVESTLSAADGASLSSRLATLSSNAAKLVTLSNAPSVSGTVRAMLALARPGVTLSDFSYAAPSGKVPGTLIVSGTAATRDALRNYQMALQGASFARSAVLPVSAYAKDSDINFTITVSLSL
jgi:hypothetical protein